jgi:hypothetical protein
MLMDVLRDVLEAMPRIEAEDARLDEVHGITPIPPDGQFREMQWDSPRLLEHNVHTEELERKLMTHDTQSLLKMEALLYYGRGDYDSFDDAVRYFRGMDGGTFEPIRTILEKLTVLREYVDRARRRLEAEGRSIETL